MFRPTPTVTRIHTLLLDIIYSRLSRCSTARVSFSGFSLVGPTNVKACKSVLTMSAKPLFPIPYPKGS